MRELEQRIDAWREEMRRAGTTHPELIEELENHLRERIATHVRSGMDEELAFQTAVAQLGSPGSIQREFRKLNDSGTISARVIVVVGLVVLAVFILRLGATSSPLLMAHVFCLTAGYVAVLICGCVGIYHVMERLLGKSSPSREEALCRAVIGFHRLALGLVGAGMLFGMFWTGWGKFFDADLRQAGTGLVALWLGGMVLMQQHRRQRMSRSTMRIAQILGNLLVITAWFGAGFVESRSKSYGMSRHWQTALIWVAYLGALFGGLLLGLRMLEERSGSNPQSP